MSTGDYVFLGVFFWILLVTARLVVFAVNIDIALKKKIWPVLILTLAAAILIFAYLLKFPVDAWYILLPIVALLIYVNFRGFDFCLYCKRMIAHKNFISPPDRCPKCNGKF